VAWWLYPRPEELEINIQPVKIEKLNRSYWLCVVAVCLVAAGFVDFPLIAYHFEQAKIAPAIWIHFICYCHGS
jgi:hypothetical protein